MIQKFSERVVGEGCDPAPLDSALKHFHQRYQDQELYRHLMHGQVSKKMDTLLRQSPGSFSDQVKIFFLAIVPYRFRNNMFHGNKDVHSWLAYTDQIRHCTVSVGHFVTHAELLCPSLSERRVA